MTDLTKFFTALSERAYKENDLSDVTYAMCEANAEFKQFFLDFFFKEFNLDPSTTTIEREHSEKFGRPDFWITTSDKGNFIVEVKIWDGNHHFEDYHKILAGHPTDAKKEEDAWQRLGYIANYKSIKDIEIALDGNTKTTATNLKCPVKTWQEFSEALQGCIYPEIKTDPTIASYIGYLKRVCPFDGFAIPQGWTIAVSDFEAVREFSENIDNVISKLQNEKKYKIKKYTGSPRWFRSQYRMGQFFEWETPTDGPLNGRTVWGWLGAYYSKDGAVVCVEFEDKSGWGDLICGMHKKYVHDGVLRFYYAKSQTASSDDNSLDDKSLNNFLTAVLGQSLGRQVSCNQNSTFCMKIDGAAKSKKLLAMKCLPFALMNHFKNADFLNDKGFNFSFVYESDEEVPTSHCGRHFRLTPKSGSEGNNGYRGWIGMLYSGNCKRQNTSDKNKDFAKKPAFVVEISKDFPLNDKVKNDWGENTWNWRYCAGQRQMGMERQRQMGMGKGV